MKSNVSRSMRRKVSNAIHAYYASTGQRFGSGGFCSALTSMQYAKVRHPALSKAMQVLSEEIMSTAVEWPYSYLPHSMLFRNQDEKEAAPHISKEHKERIRRTWLRHWTEVGVILNHDRWQALQRSRADARAVRKTYKAFTKDAAALAAEPVRDYA